MGQIVRWWHFRASPGERVDVAPPGQNQAPAAAQVERPIKIVNQLDPEDTLDALDSTEGERIILNVISRNPQSVRRATEN